MRVVNVLDVFGTGGGKSGRCMKLIMGMDQLGYEQMIIVLNQTEVATHPDIIRAKNVNLQIVEKNKIGYINATKKIFQLLNDFKPDVIQVWGKTVSASIINLYATFHRGFNYIGAYIADCLYAEMNVLEKCIHWYSKLLMDSFVGNSKAALDAYRIPNRKRSLIYNGYVPRSVAYKSKEEILAEENLDVKYIVSMSAVFRKEKDYDTFLECANLICQERNDIAFFGIGRGDRLEYYKKKVEQLGQKNIKILGFKYDIDNYYKASTLTVLCNTVFESGAVTESLSNSIVESMAVGTPVIATNSGGTPEIINNGVNGYLLTPKSVVELKQRIYELIDNPETREAMSLQCLKTIETRFEINRMINQFIELYNK